MEGTSVVVAVKVIRGLSPLACYLPCSPHNHNLLFPFTVLYRKEDALYYRDIHFSRNVTTDLNVPIMETSEDILIISVVFREKTRQKTGTARTRRWKSKAIELIFKHVAQDKSSSLSPAGLQVNFFQRVALVRPTKYFRSTT